MKYVIKITYFTRSRTNYVYATFYYKSNILWNILPVWIKEAPTLKSFQQKLRIFLLNTQKLRLDVS